MSEINNVSRFLALLENGISKPNLFRVDMSLPKGIPNGADSFVVDPDARQGAVRIYDNGGIGMMVHNANMPGVNLSTFEIFQTAILHPYKLNYAPVNLQVYVDGKFNAYRFFSTWRNMVINASNTFNYYDEFVADIKITALDEKFRDIMSVTMKNCYPVDLPGMDWSAASSNEIQVLSIGLTYSEFTEEFYD